MTKPKKDASTTQSISTAQVRDFLRENVEFFVENEDILESLSIPDDRGEAVSLITRQVALLRDKNKHLTEKLDELLHIAHTNDQLFQRIHQLTIALFSEATLEDTIARLKSNLVDNFNADFVEIRVIVANKKDCKADFFVLPTNAHLDAFQAIFENREPICGALNEVQSTFFFGEHAGSVKSAAVIPLDCPTGSALFAIGSGDENRFQPDMGHLFLTNIAELISLRLNTFWK